MHARAVLLVVLLSRFFVSGAKKDLHNVMARVLKKEFDAAYGGVWHCIVGRNFGSVVTHTSRTFIYIYIGHVAVLMFKAGSQAL